MALPARILVKKPDELTHTEAAALPLVSITALNSVRYAKSLDRVLVLGGAGGVGSHAIQILKARGAKHLTATGSTKKLDFIKGCGADEVIDYTKEKIEERTDPEFDFIFDTIGEATKVPHLLKTDGIIVGIGGPFTIEALQEVREGTGVLTRGQRMFFGLFGPLLNLLLGGTRLNYNVRYYTGDYGYFCTFAWGDRDRMQDIVELVKAKKLKPKIDTVYDLKDAKKAMEHVESGRAVGKVIIKVADP